MDNNWQSLTKSEGEKDLLAQEIKSPWVNYAPINPVGLTPIGCQYGTFTQCDLKQSNNKNTKNKLGLSCAKLRASLDFD